MYNRGGVFIASSRIIINDLLKGIVEGKDICGFLIYDAHKIRETSIESFILRVFKQGNRNGFIKAFSDEPERILGFGKTERIMQLLFVKQLFLWPRFHHTINTTLSIAQPEVIELSQPLSTSMIAVQSSVLVAMETILKELKKSNSKLDSATLTLENGVFQSFSDSIRAQLEPEWHKLSFATKQLITDLKTLRQLLDSLIRYDAITFYAYLLTIQESSMSSGLQSPSLWLTSSVAHNLFKCSKERVLRRVTLPDNSTGKLPCIVE
jgi:DNA excision repair protein ERCC-4